MPWKMLITGWGPNGPIYGRVWVADTGPKSSGGGKKKAGGGGAAAAAAAKRKAAASAAQRRAAAAARDAARRASQRARLLAQDTARRKAAAEARRLAYRTLKERQIALAERAGIIKKSRVKAPAAIGPAVRRRPVVASEPAAPAPKTPQPGLSPGSQARSKADAERWAQRYGVWRRQQAMANAKAGDEKSARELEALLGEELQRAKRDGTANTGFVTQLQEKFEEHAKAVYAGYEKLVAQINGAIASKDIERARRLYYSDDFKQYQREFGRLFGKGKDPLKEGSYNDFYKSYQDVAAQQREWWKRQMKASLQDKLEQARTLQRHKGVDNDAVIEQLRETLDIVSEQKLGQTIDHYETYVGSDGKEHSRPVYRDKTIEESLDDQRARLEMERQRVVAERLQRDVQRRKLMMLEGMVDFEGQIVSRETVPIIEAARSYAKEHGELNIKDSSSLQTFADGMVTQWEKSHPAPPTRSVQRRRWDEQRQAYERQVYQFFGTTPPDTLARIFGAPVISHGLAILQGGASSIGAGARALTGALTGDSTTIGSDLDWETAPVSAPTRGRAEAIIRARAGHTQLSGPRFEQVVVMELQRMRREWLNTPEGRRWQEEQGQAAREQSAEEDARFQEGFYGGNTNALPQLVEDPGAWLRALNEYGSEPFSNSGVNLLFNLLADPTNAIPLKFTTWAARGHYAAQASQGLNPVQTLFKAPKAFLTVDEGTLAFKAEMKKFKDEIAKKGLTEEQATDLLRERIAGIKSPEEVQSVVSDWARSIGLDPRKVSESQLFNYAEYLAKRKAGDEAIPILTQSDEFNAATKQAIAEHDAALKKATETAKAESDKITGSLSRKQAVGVEKRQKLAIKREAQEEALRARPAAPKPPRRDPNVSGASDNHVAARETGAVAREVRKRPRAKYDASGEFYQTDALGNRLPIEYRPDAEYRRLVKMAKEGDADAAEQLINRARFERNRSRMEREDLAITQGKARGRVGQTKFDFAERAGTVGDDVATERLIRDKKQIRHLKRVAGAKNADDYVRGFTRRYRSKTDRHPLVEGGKGNETAQFEESFHGTGSLDLRGQMVEDRLAIGDDILQAREDSLRGLRGLYEPFSHDATKFYASKKIYRDLGNPDFVKKLKVGGFGKAVAAMSDLPIGAASYRDGGQWLFEVFHQLRLTKDWDKLREFSDYVTAVLRDDPTNLFAWMWKGMEERSVLPYSMHINDIRSGFYHAAEAWNIHPELAFSAIPSGYYAGQVPYSFGLSAKLQGLADNPSAHFVVPGKGYTIKSAKAEITRMMLGGSGEPTRVLTYVAENFGDFYKAGEVTVRLKDELTHAALLSMGPEALANVVLRYGDSIHPGAVAHAARSRTPLLDLFDADLRKKLDKWGRTTSAPRPEYPDIREAVLKAYDAGYLKGIPPKGHTMVLLSKLQTDPDAYVSHLRVYLKYMKNTNAAAFSEAQDVVRALYDGEIMTDVSRAAAEGSGRPLSKDPYSGQPIRSEDRSRVALWREYGLMPSAARLQAYAESRLKYSDELEHSFGLEKERASWLADDAPYAYGNAGTLDTSGFTANVESLVADIRKVTDPVKAARLMQSLEGTLRNFMARLIDDGANFDQNTLDALRDALVGTIEDAPEVARVVRRLQEEMGFVRLGERLKASVEPFAFQEAKLLDELKTITTKSGTILKGHEARARAINLQIEGLRTSGGRIVKSQRHNLDEQRAQYQADFETARELDASLPEPRPEPPAATAPLASVSQAYDHIFKMSENEWLAFEKGRAQRVLISKTASAARKNAARAHIKDIEAAELAIKVEKSRGTYVPWEHRAQYRRRVLDRYGKEAEEIVAPKMVAPFVQSAYDAAVEQGRTYWRLLQSAAVGPVPSTVKNITHNGDVVDHMPKSVWDDVEQRVADAVAEAKGFRATTRTRARHRGKLEESQRPVGRMTDNDPLVIDAKRRALAAFRRDTGWNISIEAYDESRKVLWKGYVQNRTAKQLLARAERIVARTGGDLEDVYTRLRAKLAREEGRQQLGGLAYKELFGQDPAFVWAEFQRRYSDDGMLRHFTPELSPFQRATLEAHVKDISGLDKLDERMGVFLQSANRPPFQSRELTRDFLTRIGAWSPRSAEQFAQGAKSWSIWDEADYWRQSYGEVPEWTDAKMLGSEFKQIFHDEDLYFRQMKEWGIFNRSQELKLRLDGHSAEEIERAALEGDETLGIKPRRELDLQRQYVIDRYGSLVSKDGQHLDAMPWLMYPEEYRLYLAKTPASELPEGFIQTVAELDEVTELIQKAMEPVWKKYVLPKVEAGEAVSYHDMFRVASEVQAQLLANPKWARRYRDLFGSALDRWAWFNRWLVFSNPSFLVTNVVDAPIKGAYYRFTRRAFFNPSLEAAQKYRAGAEALTPAHLGQDATTAMYRIKQASARSRIANPRGFTPMERAIDRALAVVDGTGEAFPAVAGRAELAMRMNLARGMYPEVYDRAIKELGNADLAEAFTRSFLKKEINRMWPTAGDAPIEKLWNRVVPFSSYTVRNKVMFIGEVAAHPAVLNYIHHIGTYIEEQNLKDWEERHPGVEMPSHLRRRLSLPWAPDYYLDLSTFSDASRGIAPIFSAQEKKPLRDHLADWVRIVNPGVQAGVYSLFNAFGIAQKTGYVPVMENGFPTGEYKRVTVGWTEPWSKEYPDISSVFWFSQAIETAAELGADGWTAGELSQMFGQVLFFNGIKTFDKGTTLNSFYFALKAKDVEAARAWLATEEGEYLQDWWEANAQQPQDVIDAIGDLERRLADPAPWFHDQSPETQRKLLDARKEISLIREAFAEELFGLSPQSAEYKELKARMYWAINNVYLRTPELTASEVFSKTPAEWSKALGDWQTDKLMDDFMALASQRPQRASYDSTKAYNKAVETWELQKQTFLQTYPDVAARLDEGRNEVDTVRDHIEKEWDGILERVAERNEDISNAKSILASAGRDSAAGQAAQERLDMLYLQNELDYSLLERDYAATYFSDEDFNRLPKDMTGPPTLKGDFLKRADTFLDFDRRRYEKAVREGKGAEFLAEQKYQNALREAVLKAKGGDPFGKFDALAFVKAVKSDPYLKSAYFRRNEGKAKQWAETDEYIRRISVWGKLAAAGKWDEANRVWDGLPQWVKDRYYAKHPEKRRKAARTSEYLGHMKKWVSFFDKGDKVGAMRYFDSLPDWVKERYFKKHPDRRADFTLDATVARKLQDYYAGRKSDRAQFLQDNPDLAKWMAKNGSSKSGEQYAIMAAYRAIPKEEAWLRRIFRERYPEVFSQEAAGERRLKRVFDTLAAHPDVLPEFEAWVKTIMLDYEEMLKHAPRPANSYLKSDRKVPARAYKKSLSAAEMRKVK